MVLFQYAQVAYWWRREVANLFPTKGGSQVRILSWAPIQQVPVVPMVERDICNVEAWGSTPHGHIKSILFAQVT